MVAGEVFVERFWGNSLLFNQHIPGNPTKRVAKYSDRSPPVGNSPKMVVSDQGIPQKYP